MVLVIEKTKDPKYGKLVCILMYWMIHEVPIGTKANVDDFKAWNNPLLDDLLSALEKDPRIKVVFLDPTGLFTVHQTRLIVATCKQKNITINFTGREQENWKDLDFDFFVDMGSKNPIPIKNE